MTQPRQLPDGVEAVRWLLLLGLWLTYFAFGAIAASIAPLVSIIQADLALSHSAMGSVMGAWQLVYIAAAIPAGMLLDRLGGRHALAIGVVFVAASAFGRALATDYLSLLAAVMLFGVGGPIISSGAPKVVTDIFTGSRRGLAMGIYMTGPTLGGIVALTLTHSTLLPLFDQDWRQVMRFWSWIAFGAGVLWWLIASLASGQVRGFGDAPGHQRARQSIATLLRLPGVPLVLAMSVGVFLINHGLNNWLPELLRNTGRTALAAGYLAALPMAVGIVGSLTIPRLATPRRRFAILLGLCVAAAVASLALTLTAPGILVPALLIQGLVRSSLMTVLILTLVELPGMDERNAGTASGLFFSAAEVGGVLGPLSLGLMYDLTRGFDAGLYLLTGVGAALALAAMRLKRLVVKSAGAVSDL